MAGQASANPRTEHRETVILLHGLWLNGLELLLLARRLRGQGFRCLRFRYPSFSRTPAASADGLEGFVRAQGLGRVHFVAHSLGGIVLLHLFERWPDLPPGRSVLLGSPLLGSGAARRMARSRWLRRALGRSVERGVLGGAPAVPADREIGVIAGSRGIGMGRFVGGVAPPHDGTVAVAETRAPGLTDWIELRVTHFELLFSRRVSEAVGGFLRTGSFPRGAAGAPHPD
jgi:pimeloyl-ACP methyl ester carboxylesterase